MQHFHQQTFEAHERIRHRQQEAQAERLFRQSRRHRQRQRRAQLATALERLFPALQRARLRTEA